MTSIPRSLVSPWARPPAPIHIATIRQRPTTTVEGEEALPEGPETQGNIQSAPQLISATVATARHDDEDRPNDITTGVTNPSIGNNHDSSVVDTPLSSQEVLNLAIQNAAPANETQQQTDPGNTRPRSNKGASKLLSPAERLQKALRRQRKAGLVKEKAKIDTVSNAQTLSTPTSVANDGRLSSAEGGDISDADVLRGLRIVCAASADADFDALVTRRTGLRLRRFLADLQSFERLSGVGFGG